MEDLYHVKYPAHILEAYFHFEALTEHGYNFHCNYCGSHPTILIMDANRKAAFRMSGKRTEKLMKIYWLNEAL